MRKIQDHFEEKIKERLDKTERWAKENFTGSKEELEDFVYMARAETLREIADSFKKKYQHREPLIISGLN